jgi:hypothetical protein
MYIKFYISIIPLSYRYNEAQTHWLRFSKEFYKTVRRTEALCINICNYKIFYKWISFICIKFPSHRGIQVIEFQSLTADSWVNETYSCQISPSPHMRPKIHTAILNI